MGFFNRSKNSKPKINVSTDISCKIFLKYHPYVDKKRASLFFKKHLNEVGNPMTIKSEIPKYMSKVYPEFALDFDLDPKAQSNIDIFFCNLCQFKEFREYNDIVTKKLLRCIRKKISRDFCNKKLNEDNEKFFSEFFKQFM